MKISVCLMLLAFHSYGQSPEWINLTSGEKAFDLVSKSDDLWIATDGGLVKLDKNGEKLMFYTKGNANLPENRLRSVALDSSGNLWIGTQRYGVGRFDGRTCQVFNTNNSGLPFDQYVTEIAVDSTGVLWFGTEKYLSRYDGNAWKSFITAYRGYFSVINDIVFDKNGIPWLATDWGLAKYAIDTVLQKVGGLVNQITSLVVDKDNALWMGEYGLIRFDGTIMTRYNTGNSDIPTNLIRDIDLDLNGNLWLATDIGVVKYDGSNWQVFAPDPTIDSFYRLEVDRDGVVWIASLSDGLQKFDGLRWSKYGLSNSGLLSNTVRCYTADSRGNRWIVTNGAPFDRLIRFNGAQWQYYDTTQYGLLDAELSRIYSDTSRQIWEGSEVIISHDNAINEPTKWRVYNNQPNRSGTLKSDRTGIIWEATSQGLRKFDGRRWTVYTTSNSPLTSNNVARIVFDRQGNLYASTNPVTGSERGSLLVFDGINWEIMYTCESAFQWITGIAFDSSNYIWIGILSSTSVGVEYGGGVRKFDGSIWTSYNISSSQLPSNSVVDVCLDGDQNLWFGTYGGGLAKFDRRNSWTLYDANNSGLPDNNVEAIEIDGLNNKWLGVQHCGLTVFREGGAILTAIQNEGPRELATTFHLSQNYPNPFNPKTTITFALHLSATISLNIFNVLGVKIRTLVHEAMTREGSHSIDWDGLDDEGATVPSGVYIYRLSLHGVQSSRKMVILR